MRDDDCPSATNASGGTMKIYFQTTLATQIGSKVYQLPYSVTDYLPYDVIIGHDTLEKFCGYSKPQENSVIFDNQEIEIQWQYYSPSTCNSLFCTAAQLVKNKVKVGNSPKAKSCIENQILPTEKVSETEASNSARFHIKSTSYHKKF